MKYLALLRGINVGGNKKVPMAELTNMLLDLGFWDVKTFLNSGNVLFESSLGNENEIQKSISEGIEKIFGFEVKVILRDMQKIQKLMETDPFSAVPLNKDVRLYISFLAEKRISKLKLPYTSEKMDFKILQSTGMEVFSVLNLQNARSVDAMGILEKEFGKDITSRNWNTLVKIAKHASDAK